MFVGRKTELDMLAAFVAEQTKDICCVTGSLGMGKTALLRAFVKDRPHMFLSAYETTKEHELALLARQVGLDAAESIDVILDVVTKMAKKETVVVVIDQYPNLIKADAEFGKRLFSYVNEVWAEGTVKLILCGDAYMLMEKQVYGKKALWKDRIALHLDVKGMCFGEAKLLLPQADAEDVLFYYGITGGIPAQMKKLSGKGRCEALKEIYGKDAAFLPEQILSLELRELSYYNCILSAMAEGKNRVNQLSDAVAKPKDVVVPYLNALMTIGIVRKQNAITEETNRKKTRYSIVNSHMVFWYRFIVPHFDLYLAENWEALWEEVAKDLDDFMQGVFVSVSTEYLSYLSDQGKLPFTITRSGNWWRNDDEAGTTEGFDIVSLGKQDENDITVCTLCFYQERQIGVADLKGLIDMTKKFGQGGETYYVVCARDQFHENVETVASAIKNVVLITLQEEMELA